MKTKIDIYKYIVLITILFLILYIISFLYEKDSIKNDINYYVTKENIIDENDNIYVYYPRFSNDNINNIITNYIYSYIKTFKKQKGKSLSIDYKIYYNDYYANIVFIIDNSINDDKYYNIIIDTIDNKEIYIDEIYNFDIKEKINDSVFYKYSIDIYNKIKDIDIKENTYIISNDKILVYFNNIDFDYKIYVSIKTNNDSYVFHEKKYSDNSKYIVFTFDDGPSKYTDDIIKTLELNESSATFFMLGNKMKYNKDIVNLVYNSNSEVGTHSYSHKYLNKLNLDEFNEEINSCSILFNEITKDKLKYLRPPYGSYNDNVINNSPYPLILWTIDTKDWLFKDRNKIYNNIIDYACDGCIVLMHDTYIETYESLKMILPKLRNMGYEIVCVSELLKIKNIELNRGEVVKKIY
jgi:peptidoglycan/xylan/chitin deacetylase (PgdA/CDA1 family)